MILILALVLSSSTFAYEGTNTDLEVDKGEITPMFVASCHLYSVHNLYPKGTIHIKSTTGIHILSGIGYQCPCDHLVVIEHGYVIGFPILWHFIDNPQIQVTAGVTLMDRNPANLKYTGALYLSGHQFFPSSN